MVKSGVDLDGDEDGEDGCAGFIVDVLAVVSAHKMGLPKGKKMRRAAGQRLPNASVAAYTSALKATRFEAASGNAPVSIRIPTGSNVTRSHGRQRA